MKNDRIDANKICDCLRCDFLPECYMAPTAIRERRRTLRYRNLLVRQARQNGKCPDPLPAARSLAPSFGEYLAAAVFSSMSGLLAN